ncbi:MAG: phytoene desaturase family protein [Microcoleaceae cyanobacterium]
MSETADVIVIGSGIGGLSCAALLAWSGRKVIVCESHTIPGGAAHSFTYQGFKFDSGPSLHSGLARHPSTHPLKHILDVIGESVPCATYDTWGCCLPEGEFKTSVGADQFCDVLGRLRGTEAVNQWRALQHQMQPLAQAATALPPLALRLDLGAVFTVGQFLPNLAPHIFQMPQLIGAFQPVMEQVVQDEFVRNWLDLLCFLLSGLPASGTSAAEMAFMFAEWYQPEVALEYPIGGSGAIVEALVRGLKRHGGKIRLNSHVDEIVIKHNQAVGVRLRSGKYLQAKQAVVSNASIWDTLKLLPPQSIPDSFRKTRRSTPTCDSFMHLHLGIDGTDLPADLACHYIVVNDWSQGVTAPQNVVLVSIPSVLDPGLAPAGKHTIHVYTPGNEPYELWQGLDRHSPEYAAQKQARSAVMWRALERIIPDIQQRCEVTLVGTPLTHERFLRRHRGSYGPAWPAGKTLFPGPQTPVKGLLCCGDSTFPGIGLPAVAASGSIAANCLLSVRQHLQLLMGAELT